MNCGTYAMIKGRGKKKYCQICGKRIFRHANAKYCKECAREKEEKFKKEYQKSIKGRARQREYNKNRRKEK